MISGVVICYELAWPMMVLQTHARNPDRILFTSNLWWAGDTRLQTLFRLHADAWSRIFGVPCIVSINS